MAARISNNSQMSTNTTEGVAIRLNQAKRLILQDELLKVLQEIESQPAAHRKDFAEKVFAPEALTNSGVEMPKGTKILFREPKEGPVKQNKIMTISISIPELGLILIRSRINEVRNKDAATSK